LDVLKQETVAAAAVKVVAVVVEVTVVE